MSTDPAGVRAARPAWQARRMCPTPARPLDHSAQVRRVHLYTDSSLYLMLAAVPVIASARLITVLAGSRSPGSAGTLLALLVTHWFVGMWLLHATTRQYPHVRPLPVPPLVTLAATTITTGTVAVLLPGPDAETARWIAVSIGYVATTAVAPLLRGVACVLWPAGVGAVAAAVIEPIPAGILHALIAAGLIATVRVSLWLRDVVRVLDDARSAQSALAVAEERLRISRDLHDILGRNLAAIAVKSELAAELGKRDGRRATEQMLEVRGLADESLRETRDLAHGYRDVELDGEVAGARAAGGSGHHLYHRPRRGRCGHADRARAGDGRLGHPRSDDECPAAQLRRHMLHTPP
ncbi:Histidine kinase [Haloechinothrix alba]|uniref:Histidine kinase n=1 Tax=Haloechinothrix alba TaxID=664784 RepID=A0A238VE40_9PSEU|nr:histidine kinase [Haloechinothrix alba]SNR32655.1 Histidine kinase [Haloechinothrix alba]